MAIELFNHESCSTGSKLKSAYCTEMSTALNGGLFTQYTIPSSVMLTSDILSIYLAVQTGIPDTPYNLIPVGTGNWSLQAGNKFTLLNQVAGNLALHNRVIVIPNNALNLCFTGIVNSNIMAKRPLWIKRSDNTKMYDYLAVTSIDYFKPFYNILEFANTQFTDGIGSGFSNLTSDHVGMKVDFDGQYVGGVNAVNGVSSLTLDTTYTGTGISRSFLYSQGSLEFALDVSGAPGTWERHLSIPVIDTNIPYKFWVRDYKIVSADLTVTANNSIRVLGTEFIL